MLAARRLAQNDTHAICRQTQLSANVIVHPIPATLTQHLTSSGAVLRVTPPFWIPLSVPINPQPLLHPRDSASASASPSPPQCHSITIFSSCSRFRSEIAECGWCNTFRQPITCIEAAEFNSSLHANELITSVTPMTTLLIYRAKLYHVINYY